MSHETMDYQVVIRQKC